MIELRRSRTIGLFAVLVASAMAGCASESPVSNEWSLHARQIADTRLSAAHPSETEAASPLPASSGDIVLSNNPVASAQSNRGVHKPASFYLAADTPVENEQAHDESVTTTQEAEIERGPLPGFFETVERDIKEAPGLLWSDTKKVFLNPWNVLFLVGAGGASLALRPEVDDDIEDYYDRHHTFTEDWRDAFGAMGNPGIHFAAAGLWYLIGQQMQDIKTYEVGKRMFSALTITGVSTMLLKVAAYTDSPNGEELAWPSGHVSSTMAMATVLNDAYGPIVGIPMFGITVLTGIERLDSGEHHFSDLIFGAALGWVVAETVMKEHRPEIFGGEVVPYVDVQTGSAGVAWYKTLGE